VPDKRRKEEFCNEIQGNSEWMVQKENIAVTVVTNLFHKYRYNMNGKLSKFRLATLTSSTFPKCSLEALISKWMLSFWNQRKKLLCPRTRKNFIGNLCSETFRTKFTEKAPHRLNITRWVKQFEETGCLCKGKSTGRPSVNNEVVENIRAT
jgi:hypothetical protein